MKIQTIFAVVCVSGMDRSEDWYSRLLGRGPDARPMDGLVQWPSNQGAGLQLAAGGLQLEPDVELTRQE